MDRISEAVGAKVCDVLSAEGEMVTNFVAIVEVVDGEGRRWLRTLAPDTTTFWATMGMLSYALDCERKLAADACSE